MLAEKYFLVNRKDKSLPTYIARTKIHSNVTGGVLCEFGTKHNGILGYVGDLISLVTLTWKSRIIRKSVIINKPKRIFAPLMLKLVGNKIIYDLNDMLDTKSQLGRFYSVKCRILFSIADTVIFESEEYRDYCIENKYIDEKKTAIIEDVVIETNYDPNVKENIIIWIGSPETSEILLKYIDFIKEVQKNYIWILYGISSKVRDCLDKAQIKYSYKQKYDSVDMNKLMEIAKFGFAPMRKEKIDEFRGNFKIKNYLSKGVVPIAQRMRMHERLITNKSNGILFDENTIMVESQNLKSYEKISINSIKTVKKFDRNYLIKKYNQV